MDSAPPTLPNFSGARLGGSVLDSEPDYLEFNAKGRSPYEKTVYNSGMSYLAGTGIGTIYGFNKGLTSVPNSTLKVKLNSVLNNCGRFGSRAGNAVGCIALIYSLSEAFLDWTIQDYTDPRGDRPWANPILASTLTGMLYKAPVGTTPLRFTGMSGVIGFGVTSLYAAACSATGRPFGSMDFLFL